MGTLHILIVSGHLDLNHPIVSATILDKVAIALSNAEIRRLDRLYPYGNISASAEQESLLKADVIVWQLPFFWYGLPGLMKQWLDEVFVRGFAHGSTAKPGGEELLLSFATGAPWALHIIDGFFSHAIEKYLLPFEITTRLRNLEPLAPVYTCGINHTDRDVDKIAQ